MKTSQATDWLWNCLNCLWCRAAGDILTCCIKRSHDWHSNCANCFRFRAGDVFPHPFQLSSPLLLSEVTHDCGEHPPSSPLRAKNQRVTWTGCKECARSDQSSDEVLCINILYYGNFHYILCLVANAGQAAAVEQLILYIFMLQIAKKCMNLSFSKQVWFGPIIKVIIIIMWCKCGYIKSYAIQNYVIYIKDATCVTQVVILFILILPNAHTSRPASGINCWVLHACRCCVALKGASVMYKINSSTHTHARLACHSRKLPGNAWHGRGPGLGSDGMDETNSRWAVTVEETDSGTVVMGTAVQRLSSWPSAHFLNRFLIETGPCWWQYSVGSSSGENHQDGNTAGEEQCQLIQQHTFDFQLLVNKLQAANLTPTSPQCILCSQNSWNTQSFHSFLPPRHSTLFRRKASSSVCIVYRYLCHLS